MQVQALAREGTFGAAASTPLHTGAAGRSSTLASSSTSHPAITSKPLANTLKSPITTRARPPLEGPGVIIRSVIAEHGIRGLWLGQVGTLFRETGGSAAWFSAYEVVSRAFLSYHTKNGRTATDPLTGERVPLSKKDLSTWELVLAGASAGMSYNIVLFPADCVKSAMQTQAELSKHDPLTDPRRQKGARPAPKFFEVAKKIYKSRGIRGLYAGCGVTVMRSAPSSAMIFLIYETLESKFGHYF
jgi:ornithine carrier protein